jgi:hypothetical protein
MITQTWWAARWEGRRAWLPSGLVNVQSGPLSFARTGSGSLDGRPCSSDRLKTMATGTGPGESAPSRCRRCQPRGDSRGHGGWPEGRSGGAGRWRGRPAGVELRRAPNVAVMQATNFGNRDDRAERRWLDRPSVGCILVERQVSASPVIVREVRGEDASQVPLA